MWSFSGLDYQLELIVFLGPLLTSNATLAEAVLTIPTIVLVHPLPRRQTQPHLFYSPSVVRSCRVF